MDPQASQVARRDQEPDMFDSLLHAVLVPPLVVTRATSEYILPGLVRLNTPKPPSQDEMPPIISQNVWDLCHSTKTLSSELATQPTLSPGEVSKKLFDSHGCSIHEQHPPKKRDRATVEEVQRAAECGNWGASQPSEKFLRIWLDALAPLDHDPLAGVVSPSLMGSSGVVPLTIIAPLPDICRHMSNLIVRATKEVILATNYWKESDATTLISDALKELSKRAGGKNERRVVKIMYDRGSPKQFIKNHLDIAEKEWISPGVALPHNSEIPNVDLEVVNYHRPALGTFHSKFMVVDRKFGLVQSNNIQDNDNLEMMTHLEGPIVDSLYDMALLTWHEALKPQLPRLSTPTAQVDVSSTFSEPSFLEVVDSSGAFRTQKITNVHTTVTNGQRLPAHLPRAPHYDDSIAGEIFRMQSQLTPVNGESQNDLVCQHLNAATKLSIHATAPACTPEDNMTPHIPHAVHEPFPIAFVNRKPWGALNHSSVNTPQNEAWLSAIRHAESSVFIQSPDINAAPLLPALIAAVKRGIRVTLYACLGYNDIGELLPLQNGTNEMTYHHLYSQLEAHEKKNLACYFYVGKDQDHPIHNSFKQRSCHIKLMIVDESIAIQGSGNQDTQSWYHSQEVNILLESESTCKEWIAALRRNQNTEFYGMCSQEDGIWRDKEGQEAKGSMGCKPGHFAWAKGVVGAVQKVRGKGGF